MATAVEKLNIQIKAINFSSTLNKNTHSSNNRNKEKK